MYRVIGEFIMNLFKKKEKEKNVYATHTIREFLQIVEETMKNNPKVTLDSPLLISDYNMSGIKDEFKLLPTMSPYEGTMGLCLFHSLQDKVATPKVQDKVVEEEELDVNELNELTKVAETLEVIDNSQRLGTEEPTIMKFARKYGR